ncbi:MAG: hypothetical protein KDD94_07035, partial [Calditrichaeota bacterium]|nr:hypothetical protein [Calditrichota bacterium]
ILVKAHQKRETVIAHSGRREVAFYDGDHILMFLDPNHDLTTGYFFGVAASNKQYDGTIYNDNSFSARWDGIWDSGAKIYDDYWIIEAKLPLRILKFQNEDVQTWGLNIERYVKRKGEWSQWQVFRPETGTRISEIGELVGLQGLKVKQELNVLPSLLSTFDSHTDYDPSENQLWGLNLRYNIDQEHSLVGTIKPDFAQIESDEDVINYSDYPTTLPEKRPFFLEGNNIYQSHDLLYYTRRMVKPDLGGKFLGSAGNFQYGLFYVKNDGFTRDVQEITAQSNNPMLLDTNIVDKRHKEDFVFGRIKYVDGDLFEIGYLTEVVQSDYELSGQLHAIDASYRPNKQFRFETLYGTTNIEDNKVYKNTANRDPNHDALLTINYKDDWWDGYFAYHDKTKNFEQSLAGYPLANNSSVRELVIGRKFRFKEQDLQQIAFNYDLLISSTYGNNLRLTSHDFFTEFKFQFKQWGQLILQAGVTSVSGKQRHYNVDQADSNDFIDSDNFGSFFGIDEDAVNSRFIVRTDGSKPFSFVASIRNDEFKQSIINRYTFNTNFKVNYDLILSSTFNYAGIEGSQYINRQFLRALGFKIEYTILPNLFVKTYSQYSSQSRTLSNNIVFTYEYIRGSFFYLAYNESGRLWENNLFETGSILSNYQLNQRTISLKWTHSLYL